MDKSRPSRELNVDEVVFVRRGAGGFLRMPTTVPSAVLSALLALGLVYSPWMGAARPAAAAGATITVNSIDDNNDGTNTATGNRITLREAILLTTGNLGRSLNATELAQISGTPGSGGDIIVFDSNVLSATSSPFAASTIAIDCTLLGDLPVLSKSDGKIDGENRNVVLVPLNGGCSRALEVSGNGNTLKNLRITSTNVPNRFTDAGIKITGSNNSVVGVQVGPSLSGNNTFSTAGSGVVIDSGSNNTVQAGGDNEPCMLSGSVGGAGLLLKGNGTGNKVLSCNIGVATDGTASVSNLANLYGVKVTDTASGQVGSEGAGNVISNNGADGVRIDTTGSVVIKANQIGTNDSNANLPNGASGIWASKASSLTVSNINRIFFNVRDGIELDDTNPVTAATIQDNQVGARKNSTADVGNQRNGINSKAIGSGGLTISGNIVGRNHVDGIFLGPAANGGSNAVTNNRIGTNENDQSVGNWCRGIQINAAATNNTLTGNTIQNNGDNDSGCSTPPAVWIRDGLTTTLSNNRIEKQDHGGAGLQISGGTTNTIGGDSTAASFIRQNEGPGVLVDSGGIGTNVIKKTTIQANGGDGVAVRGGQATTIGGDNGDGNAISSNSNNGVAVEGDSTRARITSNSYGGNGGLAIDLAPRSDNGTVNCGDGDTSGPSSNKGASDGNGMQCPKIISAGGGVISGTVNSSNCPSGSCTVQVYKVGDADGSKHGEGTQLLGETTPANDGTWSLTVGLTSGQKYSAIAHNKSSSAATSEFASNITATSGSSGGGSGSGSGSGNGVDLLNPDDSSQDFGAIKIKAKKCGDYSVRIKNIGSSDETYFLSQLDTNDSKLSAEISGVSVNGIIATLAAGATIDKDVEICASKKAKKGKGFAVTMRVRNNDSSQSDSAELPVKIK